MLVAIISYPTNVRRSCVGSKSSFPAGLVGVWIRAFRRGGPVSYASPGVHYFAGIGINLPAYVCWALRIKCSESKTPAALGLMWPSPADLPVTPSPGPGGVGWGGGGGGGWRWRRWWWYLFPKFLMAGWSFCAGRSLRWLALLVSCTLYAHSAAA